MGRGLFGYLVVVAIVVVAVEGCIALSVNGGCLRRQNQDLEHFSQVGV